MTNATLYSHVLEAASRRVAHAEALEAQTLAAHQLADAQEAAEDVANSLGSGGVTPDELLRTNAELEIATARAARTSHQVRISQGRLLNESTAIASQLVGGVQSLPLLSGRKVVALPHLPVEIPPGKLPAAVVSQTREAQWHPSGYLYTHSNSYSGPRMVHVHIWTSTGLHRVPNTAQIEGLARKAQIYLGRRAGHEAVEVSERTWAEGIAMTTFGLRIFSSWPDVPTVDLGSSWFNPDQQPIGLAVRAAIEVPGLPASVTHASSFSKIVSSQVKGGERTTTIELQVRGASTYAPAATREALLSLVRGQVGRAFPWIGRVRHVEIVSTTPIDAQGGALEAGRTTGETAGAYVAAVLTCVSSTLPAIR